MAEENSNILVQKYFEGTGLVDSDIASFNNFIEGELQKIVDGNKIVEPTIIPSNVEEYLEFRYGKDWKVPKKEWEWWNDDGAANFKQEEI